MKNSLLILFVFSFCALRIVAQTNATVPGPEHVLVVYKVPSGQTDTLGAVSDSVRRYYQQARGIPAENVVGLSLPDSVQITIDGSTHWVGIRQGGDNIQDIYNQVNLHGATRHAWKYFIENVANQIKQHLINHNLQNQIRYIVLCKGVPFNIQVGCEFPSVA